MASSRRQYPFHLIEPKWQQHWDAQQTFRAWNPGESLPDGHPFAKRHHLSGKVSAEQLPKKFYILDMFPYPSGAGLHVGHPEGYTATDILARYRRAQGFNVLHPMGWDAFGLPAEQYAVKTGQHPRKTTEENITTFKRQIKSLGFSYDWSREIATTDTDYFKWTQWIFLKLYNSYFDSFWNKAAPISLLEDAMSGQPKRKSEWESNIYLAEMHRMFVRNSGRNTPQQVAEARREILDSKRLAYVTNAAVWWCEQLGTVLANEEVVDGKSEVGGFPVIRKPMRQWMLRITAYAEKLLADLDTIDWSDSLKEMQRNWIGKSEGAEVDFEIADGGLRAAFPSGQIRVFTTRPDTLFGATYMVLAPEHKLVDRILEFAERDCPVNDSITAKFVNVLEPSGAMLANATHSLPVALEVTRTRKVDLVEVTSTGDLSTCLAIDHKTFVAHQSALRKHAEAVQSYRIDVSRKSDLERTELAKEKTGVFTGAYAINPVNGQKIPIWIADYVLASYGTGAIMAVPAHDTRDFEFATKFNLPAIQVVQPTDPKTDWQGFTDDGVSVNSGFITGLPTPEAKKKITAWLEEKGLGKKTINYKLRDWLFSRQRYWGEPFPIVWKKGPDGESYHEALPESALPVLPPTLEDYKPTPDGQPPLARAKDWLTLPDGSTRETNTMPQWAGSCWYYLRYLDAKNGATFVGKDAENYWMGTVAAVCDRRKDGADTAPLQKSTPGVDLYVGGTEHAVLHLLYARFWHKVLFDLGLVSTAEPFFKLVNQGLILGEMEYFAFRKSPTTHGPWISSDEVRDITEEAHALVGYLKDTGEKIVALKLPGKDQDVEKIGASFVLKADKSIKVEARCFKMSKARGNVVNPDEVITEFGADSLRLYEMFMGPLQDTKPWNTKGVEGVYRFLGRVWRFFVEEKSETEFEQNETTAGDLTAKNAEERKELLNLIKLDARIKEAQPTSAQLKSLHACIKKVTEDLDGMRFNTAISAMMVFVNDAMTWETKPVAVLREFLILLAPFAPHVAEELWEKLNIQHPTSNIQHPSLAYAPWPTFDPALLVESEMEIPVQVNGKLRDVIKVPADADNATIEAAAKASEKVKPFIEGKTIKKVVVVPKRLVNLIVG